ncbi:cell division protein ZapE [Gordonia polyisoprenivorans]|uniref:cell division protein ZapE n=1 Tax=Gordonia polyisoprenivorans TaxID=84595 RepID=UPI0030D466DD
MFGRRKQSAPPVGDAVFAEAATRAGFRLDPSQIVAAQHLSGRDHLYLTGPVGRGKTWLVDTYLGALPPKCARRLHWHEFGRDLDALIKDRGLEGALATITSGIRVLCFDELTVDDRADGIYVDAVIRRAIERDIRLIITSNHRPSDLMPHPLLHATFLPSIDFIEIHCSTVEIDGGTDYRARYRAGAHHDQGFAGGMWTTVRAVPTHRAPQPESVNGRNFFAWDSTPDHIGVTFEEICGRPLGAADYLRLARRYRSWTVSGVPGLATTDRQSARRFVHLVDILYDREAELNIECAFCRTEFAHCAAVDHISRARLMSRLSTLGESTAL